ncbi:hypothetical protein A1Q_1888 [Vibrio campbellii HY01]|nr:hypothetical protein A1Q_1888 [Vibrio campbellii HY01]
MKKGIVISPLLFLRYANSARFSALAGRNPYKAAELPV